MLDHALAYVARGWAVFPLKPLAKVPLTKRGFKDASKEPATVRAWWAKWPNANIGIATGSVSGLVVLDVDTKGAVNGFDALKAFPALPETMQVDTPSGGRHYYFSLPDGLIVRNSAGKLGPGLDVRGEGGYVAAPPSATPAGVYRA